MEDIIHSFRQFALLVPPDEGLVVANGEDENVARALEGSGRRTIYFGLGESCDVHPGQVECNQGYYSFDIYCYGTFYCRATLQVPGEHNMKNALELGNRTLMMNAGQIVLDVSGEEREAMTVDDLLLRFRQGVGRELDNDRMLLSD